MAEKSANKLWNGTFLLLLKGWMKGTVCVKAQPYKLWRFQPHVHAQNNRGPPLHTAGLSLSLPVYFTSFHSCTLRAFCFWDAQAQRTCPEKKRRLPPEDRRVTTFIFYDFTFLWPGARPTVATLAYLGGRLEINRDKRPEARAWLRREKPASRAGTTF